MFNIFRQGDNVCCIFTQDTENVERKISRSRESQDLSPFPPRSIKNSKMAAC
jgi:hypothetical protein